MFGFPNMRCPTTCEASRDRPKNTNIIPICYNTGMIKIEKIIPGGQALGTSSDGKKIFFWNALPGEIVEEYIITKNKSRYQEAIATKISNSSKFRIYPKDECYLSTSPWQILEYGYELQFKQELVTEIFREHHIDIDTPEIFTDGNDYHYRNKMEYALYWDHDTSKIHLAFHQRSSHHKTPITQSSIERPEIFTKAQQVVDELNSNHDEARRYQSLLLRCNQRGEVSGGLYENHKPHPAFPFLTDTIMGHEYSYSPNGFFQINLPVYEMALQEIKQHITTEEVLDLYSGVGTIGLSVARDKTLTLVECDKYAYGELLRNIELIKKTKDITVEDISRPTGSELARSPITDHQRSRAKEKLASLSETMIDGRLQSTGATKRVRNGDIFGFLAKSEDSLDYIDRNQTVILDPPRSGCDKKLIGRLLEVEPTKIIYLSCNPATQARDVKLLLEKYQIDTVKTYNFFPHTPHIENLVILSR